ncbi:MAG: arsenate reductase ArsC [Bacteroidetes bacterium]|nr:arsenate reductase ArsC [Bacteroidota bacterium]
MEKIKVLFVCIHNSARSQMAEALLNHLAGDKFEATSAGLEKGTLNPLAVRVMSEVGIDISKNQTKDVFDFYKNGRLFNYVITVCDAANSERCPIFPSASKTLHWSFEDPSSLSGTEEEKLEKTRKVRDEIEVEVKKFIVNYQ